MFSLHAIIYFHKSVHVCVQATAHDWRLADNFQEVRSFLPPCGCRVLNSGHQACQQTPFSAEPSHRPKTDICDLGQKTKGKEFLLCVHTLSPSKPWSIKYVCLNMAFPIICINKMLTCSVMGLTGSRQILELPLVNPGTQWPGFTLARSSCPSALS